MRSDETLNAPLLTCCSRIIFQPGVGGCVSVNLGRENPSMIARGLSRTFFLGDVNFSIFMRNQVAKGRSCPFLDRYTVIAENFFSRRRRRCGAGFFRSSSILLLSRRGATRFSPAARTCRLIFLAFFPSGGLLTPRARAHRTRGIAHHLPPPPPPPHVDRKFFGSLRGDDLAAAQTSAFRIFPPF